jgi:hypothetical protein
MANCNTANTKARHWVQFEDGSTHLPSSQLTFVRSIVKISYSPISLSLLSFRVRLFKKFPTKFLLVSPIQATHWPQPALYFTVPTTWGYPSKHEVINCSIHNYLLILSAYLDMFSHVLGSLINWFIRSFHSLSYDRSIIYSKVCYSQIAIWCFRFQFPLSSCFLRVIQ